MPRGLSERLCREVAAGTGLGWREVYAAVNAWFGGLDSRVRKLPFGDVGRLYTSGRFARDGLVVSVPCLGRIGTAYSKYLAWRSRASREAGEVGLSCIMAAVRRRLAEEAARALLSGGGVSDWHHAVPGGYRRVVVMDVDGYRYARRAIPRKVKHTDKKG